DEADGQRDLAAVKEAAQRVAAQLVGAQREGEVRERREEADGCVELDGIVRRERGGEERGDAQQHDGNRAEEGRAMPNEAAEEALAFPRGAHARRTRGSSSAIAMSARRLPRMTKNAVNMIIPIRIGYSFIVRASTKSRPMPGHPKIDSVTSAPEKSTGR